MIRINLIILGIIYLASEFVFNASLLDLLSRNFGPSELHEYEVMGKLISGVGLWLTLMKLASYAGEKISKVGLIVLTPILLGISLFTMANVQDAIATHLADNSTAEERKAAYALSYIMPSIISGDTVVAGFDLSIQDYKTAEGKTYLALLPAFGISSPNASEVFALAARKSIETSAHSHLQEGADAAWTSYSNARENLRLKYNNEYLSASQEFTNKTTHKPDPQEAWGWYIAKMDEKHINIDEEQSERTRKAIIYAIKKKGILLPSNWMINDKETFIKAVSLEVSPKKFADAISKKLGRKMSLPPNLSWDEFVFHKDIQNILKEQLNMASYGVVPINLTKPEFVNLYSKKASMVELNKLKKLLLSSADTFVDGGVNSIVGRDAIKRVKVPVISLGFSCLFTLINLAMVISGLVSGYIGSLISLAFISIILVIPLSLDNRISSSKAFNKVIQRESKYVGISLAWVTNSEPYVYPAGRLLKNFLISR